MATSEEILEGLDALIQTLTAERVMLAKATDQDDIEDSRHRISDIMPGKGGQTEHPERYAPAGKEPLDFDNLARVSLSTDNPEPAALMALTDAFRTMSERKSAVVVPVSQTTLYGFPTGLEIAMKAPLNADFWLVVAVDSHGHSRHFCTATHGCDPVAATEAVLAEVYSAIDPPADDKGLNK